jgi:hypothetical protein
VGRNVLLVFIMSVFPAVTATTYQLGGKPSGSSINTSQ